ncbi:MAG TPA: FecR domain-containing protein [Candidatus Sulfotelmatobacter sp.]|jgi:transmembrane sensor|nr:FecR domain-containing protein [Candidatus Sulfotelmatobacter sp.]
MRSDTLLNDLEDQAIGWHVRLNDPSVTVGDRAAFERWIARSSDHAKAYERACGLWGLAGQAAPGLGAGGWYRRNGRADVRWLAFKSRVAALPLLAAGLAAILFWRDPSWFIRMDADYAAPPGPVKPLDLADGSHLQMEGGAALNVAFASDRRLVALKRGKVWFDVSHTGVPFEVSSDNLDVRVVGTAFSVEDSADGGTVAVERGSVQVSTSAHPLAVTLVAGQRAQVSADGRTVAVGVFDPVVAMAWRRDLVVFDRASLTDVAGLLEHLRPGRVMVVGEDLRRESLSGTFSAASPDAIVTALSESMGVKVASLPGVLLILYR